MNIDNLRLIPFFHKKNKYLIDNVPKRFIDKYISNYKYIHIDNESKDTNNKIINFLKTPSDIIILAFHKHKLSITSFQIPTYPILYIENNSPFIIVTPILLQQINGFSLDLIGTKNQLLNLLDKIKYILGGILTNTLLPDLEHIDFKDSGYNSMIYPHNSILSNTFVNEVNNKFTKYLPSNYHGWLSTNTKLNLEYAIHQYKPKNILELGTWLGKSTFFIKTLIPNCHIYTVDKFQNVLDEKAYVSTEYTPLDKFYYSYPRYETVCKNLSKFSNVYLIKFDINKIINLIKKYNIIFDMIFIDAIKKTDTLVKFINEIFEIYPKSIIVGDDYVFESVKKAVSILSDKYYFKTGTESYICSKKTIKHFEHVEEKINVLKIKEDNIKNITNNFSIDSAKELSNLDRYALGIELLNKHKFKDFLQLVKYFKLDPNTQIKMSVTYDSFYHILSQIIRKKNKEAVNTFKKLLKIHKPRLEENQFNLTYKDYLNYDIKFH